MTKKILTTFFFIFCLCAISYGTAKTVVPNLTPGEDFVTGQLLALSSEGQAYYCAKGSDKWLVIQPGMSFSDEYMIRTGANGYLVLTWSANNIIYIKPHTGLVVRQNLNLSNRLVLNLHHGDLMVSARNSGGIVTLQGHHIASEVVHGDMSFTSKDKHETVRAVSGISSYRLRGGLNSIALPEQSFIEVDSAGRENVQRRFYVKTEYESFKRFSSFMGRFENYHKSFSNEFDFKLSSIRINDEFINNMAKDGDMLVIKSNNGTMPKNLLFQAKIKPYPAPHHRIELNLGSDLVYVFREGRNGYHEVNFELPSVPEFIISIHYVDSHDRRIPLFNQGFCINNRARLNKKAQTFCKDLSDALKIRNSTWVRAHISQKYRDFLGNSEHDFVKSTDDAFREYHNIRLDLRPFKVYVKNEQLFVRVNYRLSALTRNYRYRYEKKGTELLTLAIEDGEYKLVSKSGGLFFGGMNVTVDLRRAVLSGRVLNELTGLPMEGVEVSLVGTNFKTFSNFMGEYLISNVPVGTYNVRFSKNGYGVITASNVTLTPAGR